MVVKSMLYVRLVKLRLTSRIRVADAAISLGRPLSVTLSTLLFAIASSLFTPHLLAQEANNPSQLPNIQTSQPLTVNEDGYKVRPQSESVFDNKSDSYIKDWREAAPKDKYDDTEFGNQMYNEASTSTKLEVLRLLSKDTPSVKVFMTAVSMGLDIESVLQASVQYDADKARDLAASAVSIAPLLGDSTDYSYSEYELEDIERDDESEPFSVQFIAKKFFEERLVLRPSPDWFQGQYHFMASAAELKGLQKADKDKRWYKAKSTDSVSKRPIFVSLYESNQAILIDGHERINSALAKDSEARLPVVFIFNRLDERPVDDLGYPLTIQGTKDAYTEKGIMLTPAPEWQIGDYHMYAKLSEFEKVFNIPQESDFEPEAWQKLLVEAENYSVTDTSFLVVILGLDDSTSARSARFTRHSETLYAAWSDPRSEADFPYVAPQEGPPATFNNIMKQGIIFNRPDLIAALGALGVGEVPVAFYYLDSARTAPYLKDPDALIDSVIGAGARVGTFGGDGGTPPPPAPPVCASPPCTE